MTSLRFWEPAVPAALAGVVDGCWACSHDGDAPLTQRVLPDGCVDLIWSAGADVPRLSCLGPSASAILTTITPRTAMVGVRLRQGHARALLGLDLNALGAQRVDATSCAPALPRVLAQRLPHASAQAACDDACALMLDALERQLALVYEPPDPRALAAIALLERSAGALPIAQIAQELELGERTLRRALLAATGLSPKTLARISRLRHTLRALHDGAPPLAQLALDLGFADQAHMSRELRAMTGQTPRQLIAAVRSVQD